MSTTKSGSVLFTLDVNETQIESIKKHKQKFIDNQQKRCLQQVEDLEMTLEINKGIICDLLQSKSMQQVECAILTKLNDENTLIRKRIKEIAKERDDSEAKVLLLEQINHELKSKEQENARLYEDGILDIKEKLERKEYFIQIKERKWMQVEKILEEYIEEDDELKEKLQELRINVDSTQKITNVVEENEKLKSQLSASHEEVSRLRKQLLAIDISSADNKCTERISPKEHSLAKEDIFGQQQKEKKEFLSTAPINHSRSFKQGNLKIKESKAELKQYSHQLEEALAKTRQKFIEIEKDNEILNKTYLRELKKGDRMQQTLKKVKQNITTLYGNNHSKLCIGCLDLKEIQELAKLIQDRIFDVSNEAEITMEQLEMPFKNQDFKKTRAAIISRQQTHTPIIRSRRPQHISPAKSQLNRFSSIIPEEELNVKYDSKSPGLGYVGSRKISAIGMFEENTDRKDSPFWDHENGFEIQQALEMNPFEQTRQCFTQY